MTKQKGILRPLGLALILALGFEIVIAVVFGWCIGTWQSLRPRERGVNESLTIRLDGTPLIQSTTFHQYTANGYNDITTYRKLDGSAVSLLRQDEEWLNGASLTIPRYTGTFPLHGYARIGRFSNWQTPPVLWYFIDNGDRDGRGYFEGYDSASKRRTGFIGRNGIRPDRPPVEEWFPMDGIKLASDAAFSVHTDGSYWGDQTSPELGLPTWKVGMISDGQLLEVDLAKGSVTTLFESANLISVGILETAAKEKTTQKGPPQYRVRYHLAVRTSDRVLVLDPTGKQEAVYPIPDEFRDQGFTIYELADGKALLNASRPVFERGSNRGYENDLAWIDGSGKVLRREAVLLDITNGWDEEGEARMSALLAPAPALLAYFATVAAPDAELSNGRALNYSVALAQLPYARCNSAAVGIAALDFACLLLLAAASEVLSARRRHLVRIRLAHGPARLCGLSLPSPLAGAGGLPVMRAARASRPRCLCGLRQGIPAAAAQGNRGVCLTLGNAETWRCAPPKGRQFAQRRAKPWLDGDETTCGPRANGPIIHLIGRNGWPVGPKNQIICARCYQGCALRWITGRPFGAHIPSLSFIALLISPSDGEKEPADRRAEKMETAPENAAEEKVDQMLREQRAIDPLVQLTIEIAWRLADFKLGKLFQDVFHCYAAA